MLPKITTFQPFVFLVMVVFCPSVLSASTSSLDYEFYEKFPNLGDTSRLPPVSPPSLPQGTYQGLQHFYAYLGKMRKAKDDLRTYCIGPASNKMTAVVRGSNVLIWPERYAECEGYAVWLKNGDSSFDLALSNLNKAFNTNYPPPRGDATDVSAWQQRKLGIVSFSQPECNEASRSIVLHGTPGFTETPHSIITRMKPKCPKNWVALFRPDGDPSKNVKSPKVCNPAKTYQVSDEQSPTGLREACDEADKISAKELGSKQKEKREVDSGLEAELDALAGGSYKGKGHKGVRSDEINAFVQERRAKNGQLVADLETGVREAPKAGEINGVAIIGGETGKLLEQSARASERNASQQVRGCDDEQERQATIKMQEPRLAQIQKLPLHQQACPFAQLNVDIYQRALGYAERCNRREAISSIRAEINNNQALVRQECNGAQGVSSSSRSSNSSNGFSGTRDAGSSRRCLQWRGSASDPSCVSWSR